MDLFINGVKVDFTLEEEKTLGAMVASLEAWLAEQKLLLAALKVNGEEYDQTLLNKNTSLAVEDISRLEITASDFIEFAQIQLASLFQYFANLKIACEQKNFGQLSLLLESFAERLQRLIFLLMDDSSLEEKGELNLKLQKHFLGTTTEMVKLWDSSTLKSALQVCDDVLIKIEQRRTEYEQFNQTAQKLFNSTLSSLREIGKKLTEVSLLLQTGKDDQAMQIIINFSELTQLFLQLAGNLITNTPSTEKDKFENKSTELNQHLKELLKAFQKKDFVLIGDLCEYEIAPKLNSLLDLSETIFSDLMAQ